MANLKDVEEQLKRIGCNYRFWGRWEIKELANVILPGESIEHCVNGTYEGGFAMLVATDQRILLIDKKPMYLTLEDIRFDMVSELDFHHRLLNSNLRICTPNKELRFTGYNNTRLRRLFNFAQHRVMTIRHYYMAAHQGTPIQQATSFPQVFDNTAAAQADPVSSLPSALEPPMPSTSSPTQTVLQSQQPANHYSSQHISMAGMKRVVPVISAYTRLPLVSRERRYAGSSRIA